MKIAFFCDAYKPTRSGVVVSVDTTAQELRSRGHEVVIYAPYYKGYSSTEQNVVRFPAGRWFRARDFSVAWPLLPLLSPKIEAEFHRQKFDIVHSHSPFTIGTVGSRWARRTGVPVVFTFHTMYHHYLHYVPLPPAVTRAYIIWWVGNYCRDLCDLIVAPSRPIEQIVKRLAPRVQRTILPTGIDIERFSSGNRRLVRERYQIPDDELILLYVGRLVWEKNLTFLLQSLAPLLQEYRQGSPTVRLMMVGGGPAMEPFRAMTQKLGIADRVLITDFIEPSAIADFYAAGNIFTFASRTETQGVSIAEALAAGLPCVVIGAMGAGQAITHGREGFITPPRQNAYREAVARLVREPELRARMSAAARTSPHKQSMGQMVDALLEIYHRQLAASPT